jgi:outer membrane biogenesis lipoprotein LolB
MPAVIRPRLRHLLLLLLACAVLVGCGLSAATGPQPEPVVTTLDTSEPAAAEPTGRAYLATQP